MLVPSHPAGYEHTRVGEQRGSPLPVALRVPAHPALPACVTHAPGFLRVPDSKGGPHFPVLGGKSGDCVPKWLRAGALVGPRGLAFPLLSTVIGPRPGAVSEDILVSAKHTDGMV